MTPQLVIDIAGGFSAIVGMAVFVLLGAMMWKLATRKADRSALMLALGLWSLAGLVGFGMIGIILDDSHQLSHAQSHILDHFFHGSLALSGALLTAGFLMSGLPRKKP